MGSRKLLLLLMVFFAGCVGTCRPWDDDAVEEKAEEAKKFAKGVAHDAGQSTRAFSSWVQDKFSKTFGGEEDKERHLAQHMKYNAEEAGTMKSAASGASNYASERSTDAMEAVPGAMAEGKENMYEADDGDDAKVIKLPTSFEDAKDTVGETVGQAGEKVEDIYDDAKEKFNTASDKASSMAHNAIYNMDESIGDGKDIAANAYDEGKEKMNMASEKFVDAGDKVSDVYDEARNKVKRAVGCGRKMGVDALDEAREGMNMVGDKVNDAKDNTGVTNEYGRDKVAETFDQATREVEERYASANTMTEEAKAKYEAAKERASDAAGDVGEKMRNTPNQ
ncbi:hypothetical protein PHAVU_002G031100 [Phaseolus vulgaris]